VGTAAAAALSRHTAACDRTIGDTPLAHRLLCDVDRSVGIAYGAADAPEAGYAKRISYVIGEDGRILHAYPKVDPNTHLDQELGDVAAS
jgi:peroxiredoxin